MAPNYRIDYTDIDKMAALIGEDLDILTKLEEVLPRIGAELRSQGFIGRTGDAIEQHINDLVDDIGYLIAIGGGLRSGILKAKTEVIEIDERKTPRRFTE